MNEKKSTYGRRPSVEKIERLDNMAIQYFKTAKNLQEGQYYIGRITDSYALKGAKGITLKVVITLENNMEEVETSHVYPLNRQSPLNDLFAEVETEKGSTVGIKDLKGMRVEFSVSFYEKDGKVYQNLASIVWIYEDDTDKSEDNDSETEDKTDDSDDNGEDEDEIDEDEELDSFFEED